MGSATISKRLISLAALTLICLSTLASSSLDNRTAYEILEDYNFPVGLLPKGVKDYDFNINTGKFSAYFNDTCNFSLESSYQLRYKPTIKGYLSDSKLSTLEGVYVRLFFMWMEIVEIVRSGDDLFFSVGALSSVFPIDNFVESPQCGCGFQCGGEQLKKLRSNPFIFSLRASEDYEEVQNWWKTSSDKQDM